MGSLMSKQDGKPSPNSYSGTHEEEGKTRKPLLEPDTQRQVTSEVQAQVQQRPSTQRNGNDLDGIRSTAGLTRRQLRHISSSSSDDYGIRITNNLFENNFILILFPNNQKG